MKAYLYILDTLADWEIGFITSELHTGRYFDKTKDPVYMIKIGNTTKPITTMGGMTITPDESIENITFRNGDLLILPGADTWMDKNNKKDIGTYSGFIGQECRRSSNLRSDRRLGEYRHFEQQKAHQ